MYLLWRMYPTQSSDVTMPNAIASRALVAVHTWKILSLAFKMLFTWLKTSSNGIRSGEYGGKKLLLLVQQSQLAGSTWWTEQLSIITIDRGLVPSNGFRIGIRVSETNSSNLSPFTDPSTNWTSCTPSMDITVIPEYPTPRIKSLWSRGGIPRTPYPYLLWLFRQSHPVSSIQTNIVGSYNVHGYLYHIHVSSSALFRSL